ncbi:hypothetical protein J4E86_011694 [Alternaria arbusti]|uniref:uncharacterized protein n=1 Tax=Alternaria arbusti TaxID=232088 RepID=UPI00221F5043|nr:uncharacterized protein J4E86_011694 [Alternaria arbusti]KAI4929752.1 hypothetical protein J4E86_011694 [Alternaria arbusti]
MEEREYQLPACQKCKLRKVKCDRQAPKCTNCRKGNAACIIVDAITGEQYARDYIRQLEEKELNLQRRLGDRDETGVATPASTERSDVANRTPTGPETVTSSDTQSGFVGDGSGLGFLQNILSDTKWQHHRAQILEQLAKRPRIARHRPVARALPPLAQARQLFDNYFTRFHDGLSLLKEQHQRRIFWECYVHDRYSSGILGRPFALLESEISMPLPIDADDETIVMSGATVLEDVPSVTNVSPSELSVNLFCIKLRRLSSRVHTAFYTGRKPASYNSEDSTRTSRFQSIGHIYSSFVQFDKESRALRSSVPVFVDPKCLYERSEWHDFMYEKDRLLLARGAMHNLPARQFSGTSIVREILKVCYQSAIHTIQLYADLRRRNAITWTRSYFEMIFTAGLTVIYCIILGVLSDNDELSVTNTETLPTLDTCSSLLNYFKDKMPDAGSFATVFSVILKEFVKDRFTSALQVSENVPANPIQPSFQQPPTHDAQIYPDHHLNADSLHSSMDTITADHLRSDGQEQERVNLNHLILGDFPDLSNHQESQDFGMGLTNDLLNQLEYGLGEYAWGSLNTNVDYWNSFSYN